ncbi:hypothetical protein CABS01_04660 [Colletotrichum abscissum]|uniref:Uncharacterized protein n=1 Tax=Colletotrichum abscissum TaxID=1671311 RepID=A0A9P9WZB9_9PEZI|nr:uncharacterized protein CABS01_04660 [Colletotrichum abscissum]KAI3527415.1 hypothetical protein CABS02_15378 [Colletotrichum abscissum]KAK1472017.1 hypothetical protein CABS01_04660 [Colletotrichum abscissum]
MASSRTLAGSILNTTIVFWGLGARGADTAAGRAKSPNPTKNGYRTGAAACILPFCEFGNGLFDDGVILEEHVVQPSLIGCVDGVAYSISQKYMPLPSVSELAACSSKGLAALSQVIDVPLSNSIRGIRTP